MNWCYRCKVRDTNRCSEAPMPLIILDLVTASIKPVQAGIKCLRNSTLELEILVQLLNGRGAFCYLRGTLSSLAQFQTCYHSEDRILPLSAYVCESPLSTCIKSGVHFCALTVYKTLVKSSKIASEQGEPSRIVMCVWETRGTRPRASNEPNYHHPQMN